MFRSNIAVHATRGEGHLSFQITTERLVLEDLTDEDLPGLRRIARDRELMKYVLIWLETDEQIARFLQHAIDEAGRADRTDYVLAARTKETDTFAGLTFIEIDRELKSTAEVGIVLLPAFCNAGYGSEILRAYLAFGFETLGMHRVYGKCDELNIPSAGLMEKGGLRYEGTIREHVWLRDHWRSTRYYGMLRSEYSPSL
jgi:[ribosomal protein S5]-alanine N-acetyltransferase